MLRKYTEDPIIFVGPGEIFVFGSNEAGIHGAGAALDALKWGAISGVGVGRRGNTYAIPTKDGNIKTLPLARIEQYIKEFLEYAKLYKFTFLVTKVGCGLAGYTPEQIAPFFRGHSENVVLPESFVKVLESN